MVTRARELCSSGQPEHAVLAWLRAETCRITADHGEAGDSMVRETIAYALDSAWRQACGHDFGAGPQPEL